MGCGRPESRLWGADWGSGTKAAIHPAGLARSNTVVQAAPSVNDDRLTAQVVGSSVEPGTAVGFAQRK